MSYKASMNAVSFLIVVGAILGWLAAWAHRSIHESVLRREQRRRIGISPLQRHPLQGALLYALTGALAGMLIPSLVLLLTPPYLLEAIPTSVVLTDGWAVVATLTYGGVGGFLGGLIAALRR